MNKFFHIILPLFVVLCTSCFEEDEPLDSINYPENFTIISNNIGYNQSYFDFESKEVVAANPIDLWDVGFESSPRGWHIKINSGNELFVLLNGTDNLTAPYIIRGNENWKYDEPGGHPDSTAIGNWCDTTHYPFNSNAGTYVIGKSTLDGYFVYARMQFVSADSNNYIFRYALENSDFLYDGDVSKCDSVNYVYFNFMGHQQVYPEPCNKTYDLLFTPYYDLISFNNSPYIPYLVRGVFINRNVSAYLETNIGYDEFAFSDIDYSKLCCRQDVIGYNWKEPDINFGAGTADYSVLPGRIYIIRSIEGKIYKLQFLGYTLNGENGYPKFEYKILNSTLTTNRLQLITNRTCNSSGL